MKHHSLPDLHEVRAGFEVWRRTRQGKERIPAPLREAVRQLLQQLPTSVVGRELHLSTRQLERLRHPNPPHPPAPAPTFVALTALDLPGGMPAAARTGQAEVTTQTGTDCLAVLERRDGATLSLRIPVNGLETVIASFVRA